MSSYDYEKIDYTDGAVFNYKGISLVKQIFILPPFVILMFFPESRIYGVVLIAIFGIAGLFSLLLWIESISNNIINRRYIMARGFCE